MHNVNSRSTMVRSLVIMGSVLIVALFQMVLVANAQTASRDFSTSDKQVNAAMAEPGDTLTYTITIRNTDATSRFASLTDNLPTEVSYVNNSLSYMTTGAISQSVSTSSSAIAWTGTISPSSAVSLTFQVTVNSSGVPSGTTIMNTAAIAGSSSVNVTATTTISTSQSPTVTLFLPMINRALDTPFIMITSLANAANSRTISWTAPNGAVSYEIQQSTDSTFATAELFSPTANSQTFAPAASYNNAHYYRVRAVAANGVKSDWSEVKRVVGAYRDDFNSADSGWAIRRTTFLEKVKGFYETGSSWYVIQVVDRWDWGIAAPMREAPPTPYAIEMRVEEVTLGNLISFGIVTGGNWDGEQCIITGTQAGIYERLNCFSQFYNANIINKGGGTFLKLLWEQIDELVWCPSCGGSPMKRLSNNVGAWPEVNTIPNTNNDLWNTFRIEVYDNQQRMFINGQSFATFNSSDYTNRPYFGVFASTDEYNNSTWRIDWVTVTPID